MEELGKVILEDNSLFRDRKREEGSVPRIECEGDLVFFFHCDDKTLTNGN